MPQIKLTNVTKRWGDFYAVDDLCLDIDDNAFVTLLGPSGCGKTTTLRMIAGLETPTAGKIQIGDTVVFDSEAGVNIPPNKRKVGFLFQNYALWPNMTVEQNIAFGLQNLKQEMPCRATELERLERLAELSKSLDELVDLIWQNCGKNGKIVEQKAILALIDTCKISIYSAQEIFDRIKDLRAGDARIEQVSRELQASFEKRAADERARLEKSGWEIDEAFNLLKGGAAVVQTRKLDKEEIDLRIRRVSRVVKIGMFMERYPAELSGGQQQRVAIARTLAPEPQVLFMDEPLSNLDAKLRLEMRYELQRLHIETGSTFVYVTHDQMEAMTLATKICLMNNGVLQQYDAPLDVYGGPKNLFVADFVGNPSINFVDAKGAQNADGSLELSIFDGAKVKFKPNENLDLAAWQKSRDDKIAAGLAAEKARFSQKGFVEKGNKDEVFAYKIAYRDESEGFSGDADAEPSNEDFVLAIRPEFIEIGENGKWDCEIFGAMPTGCESTIKIGVGKFLLTSVIFGSVTYKIGSAQKFSFKTDGILLFDKKSGALVTKGAIE